MKKTTASENFFTASKGEIHLFAAANTRRGFVSYFDKAFCRDEVKRIYILKGGPGVGKSTLMKKYAERQKAKGKTPIYYHCSSDPGSLDGVFVKETGIAIVDGTAPHVFDPVYPGVRDFYVNLSEAWDVTSLQKEADRIKSLANQKSACYKTAYRLLEAAGKVAEEMKTEAAGFTDTEKIRGFVKRFARKYIKSKPGDLGRISEVVVNAVSAAGDVRYYTLEKQADTLLLVKDAKSAAVFIFDELADAVRKSGVDGIFALSAENPSEIFAIYLPEASLCISRYSEDCERAFADTGKSIKTVNASRFINAEGYRGVRQKYRFAEKCYQALREAALSELSGAGRFHMELEKLYIAATDYKKVDRIAGAVADDVT